MEEKESREVAEIVGCRESTVRNHLFQARRLLREELKRRFPEYVPEAHRSAGGAGA
jgi:Sigma-70, region 4.